MELSLVILALRPMTHVLQSLADGNASSFFAFPVARRREFVFNWQVPANANDENAFAILGHSKVCGVKNLSLDCVACLSEHLQLITKEVPEILTNHAGDILNNECLGPNLGQCTGELHVE